MSSAIVSNIVSAVMCHLVGDYVLQCDFIANTKGKNWYHLLVHCALYTLPFFLCFGLNWKCGIVFLTHIPIDALKARYKKITYTQDQIFHYIIAILLYWK